MAWLCDSVAPVAVERPALPWPRRCASSNVETPRTPPRFFSYFDEAELAAELGHYNRDLGRSVDATSYAHQSLGDDGEYVRSDFFVTMVLADSYLDQGEAEESCRVALTGLEIRERLKSALPNLRPRVPPMTPSGRRRIAIVPHSAHVTAF